MRAVKDYLSSRSKYESGSTTLVLAMAMSGPHFLSAEAKNKIDWSTHVKNAAKFV